MKYAVMSDVHSNPQALRIALEDAERMGCERYLFLGDVTGYGYDVKTSLKLVREGFDVVLMGNHDSVCAGLEPERLVMPNPNYDIDRAQRGLLAEEDLEWLRTRPYVVAEGGAAFAHGDFTRPKAWNYILTIGAALRNFFSRDERVLFCGHSHHATVLELTTKGRVLANLERQFGVPVVEPETVEIELREGIRYIVNVGSVGYPRNDLCASYAIYDPEASRVSVRRLPFDFRDYVSCMQGAKIAFPPWLMELLMAAVKEGEGQQYGR